MRARRECGAGGEGEQEKREAHGEREAWDGVTRVNIEHKVDCVNSREPAPIDLRFETQ